MLPRTFRSPQRAGLISIVITTLHYCVLRTVCACVCEDSRKLSYRENTLSGDYYTLYRPSVRILQ